MAHVSLDPLATSVFLIVTDKDSQSRTYFLFAGLNFIWIGIVYLVYPETSNRSLESIEAMFTTSPFYWQMEKAYAENKDMFATTKEERLSKEKQLDCSHDELTHV